MSGRPQDSVYYPRARTPQSAAPAPNNIGVVLLVMVLLAIVGAALLVGPNLIAEARHIVYCIGKAHEAACS